MSSVSHFRLFFLFITMMQNAKDQYRPMPIRGVLLCGLRQMILRDFSLRIFVCRLLSWIYVQNALEMFTALRFNDFEKLLFAI